MAKRIINAFNADHEAFPLTITTRRVQWGWEATSEASIWNIGNGPIYPTSREALDAYQAHVEASCERRGWNRPKDQARTLTDWIQACRAYLDAIGEVDRPELHQELADVLGIPLRNVQTFSMYGRLGASPKGV